MMKPKIPTLLRALLPAFALFAVSATARAVTLNPTADTDTQSDVAAGTNATLNVSQWDTGLLRFDLSSVSGTVTSAILRVYLPNGTAATTYTVATTSTDSWSEGGSKPGTGSAVATKAVGALGAGYIEIDVTSHVQSKLAGDKIVSVALNNTLSGWTSWNSRQASSNQPQLVITTQTSGGSTNTLNPAADTDSQSDSSAGTNAGLNVSLYDTGLLKFSLAGLSGTVSSATLRVYLPNGTAATTYTLHNTSTDSWSEGGTKPATGSTTIVSKSVGALGAGYLEFDVTSYVQNQLNGDQIVSVAMNNGLSTWTSWNARESATNKPQLVVVIGSGGTGGGGGGGGGTVSRPSYNTGTGFFVLNGKLYDKNGVEFHIRGMDKLHWDFGSTGMWNANANAIRYDLDFTQPTSTNLGIVNAAISHHIVPIPGNWNGTCQDESYLDAIVTSWVNQASAWLTVDDKMLLNIANELGSGNSTAWRDAYINAVTRLRNAGYKCPIVVDSGGCGQDAADIENYATAIMNADPQHNIIFDVHIYGNWGVNGSPSWAQDLASNFDAMKNTGMCVLVGEFGPGNNIGPSPTMITPAQVISAADSHNFGWLAWAWDDNPSAGDSWFALCANTNLDYNSSADLTTFGRDVIENTTYGLKAKAVKQTAF